MSNTMIKIDGQWIFDDGEFLRIHIRELWWGAYKIFGWEEGVAGIGISEKILTERVFAKYRSRLGSFGGGVRSVSRVEVLREIESDSGKIEAGDFPCLSES